MQMYVKVTRIITLAKQCMLNNSSESIIVLQNMFNKPKINLPNRSNPDQPPCCQFQAMPPCLMSTLEEKVVFKERTEHLLNIQNFI